MPLHLMTDEQQFTVTEADLLKTATADADVVFTYRLLTRPIFKGFIKAHTTMKPNRRTHREDAEVNWVGVAEDAFDYCLVAWSGVLLNGEPAPCSRELKLSGLDQAHMDALLELAGMNQMRGDQEARAASFRTA